MRYTRDNPAPMDAQRPGRLVPHRAWWAARPTVAEASWIAPLVCSGRGTHRPVRLAEVARCVFEDGRADCEVVVSTDRRGRQWVFPPDEHRGAGEGSRTAWAFWCPRCALNLRVTSERLALLARRDVLGFAELDVSALT